ncbi:unnamed protein product [Linum trigynum]|uniref:Reverse transcriptase domain-containing protein n=1 Tax=Linum trigynum TaxID=586398 RepID=A0AAV2CKK0_9ROSI
MVSRYQFAGRKKKLIHEASLIANEAIDSRKRSGKPGIILKLDIEKAFDSVNWDCLRHILRNMGMNVKLVKWIMGLVTYSKLSVLVNGESSGFFSMERGLKQGDPLSPLLFSIVMDIFSFIVESMQEAGLISGFHFDKFELRGQVSHLLYADDAIVFCNATEEEVFNVLAALLCFQSITGLRINLDKSKLYPVGEVRNIGRLAEILGCDWSFLHTVYLGLPLGAQPTSSSIWDSVLIKTQRKLDGWQGNYLSLGGRVTLCKAVLASQPLYQCSLFRAPANVIQKLERIQKDFIWSGPRQEKKFHLLAWDSCKAPKKFGGLGILDLRICNTAMLAKWLWKFSRERDEWWRDLISIKYPHSSSEWISGEMKTPVGCSPWSQILKTSKDFWKFAWVEPGGGAWASFWFDVWIKGRPPLAESFPRVFAAAESPCCQVAEVLHYEDGPLSWELNLRHSLRGGAEGERIELFNLLHSVPLSLFSAGPARITWEPSPSTGFQVKSMYENLFKEHFNLGSEFPSEVVWLQAAPFKVCVFLLLVYHNKVLTQDNLKKSGWLLPNRCAMCCEEEETVDHLFLSCRYSLSVWQIMRCFVKLPAALGSNISSVLRNWSRKSPACPQEWCSRVFIHALCWRIWLERNNRVFSDNKETVIVTCVRIGRSMVDWLCAHKKVDRLVAEDWLRTMKNRILSRSVDA